MPLERPSTEGKAPTESHLALLMDASGLRVPIPPGASLWVVEDASDQNKIFPLTLKEVSHKRLVFVMMGKDGALTEYRYELRDAKPLNRAALQRLRENRGDLPTAVHRR